MNMDQARKCKAEFDSGNAAMGRGDTRAAADHFLSAVVGFPGRTESLRFTYFDLFSTIVFEKPFDFISEKSKLCLEKDFVDNDLELCVYRAQAALLLARYHVYQPNLLEQSTIRDHTGNTYLHKKCPIALSYNHRAIDLCDKATAKERRHIVTKLATISDTSPNGQDETMGDVLDKIRMSAQAEFNYQKDPMALYSDLLSHLKIHQKELAREFMGSIMGVAGKLDGNSDFESGVRKPPAVTSMMIEKVKALPETDFTLLLWGGEAMHHRGTDPGIVFRAFKVDIAKFQSGHKKNVFTHYQCLKCSTEQTKQKNLLSVFMVSCLEPYVFTPISHQTHPSTRPRQVLLQDADDTHVRSFLSMMGCQDIQKADPLLLNLLQETYTSVLEKGIRYAFPDSPHLLDYFNQIGCGNCNTVGPQLKRCSCGKAYYCTNACQQAHWADHKTLHRSTVARKNAGVKH